MTEKRQQSDRVRSPRGTRRLTLESSGGNVRLVSQERLDMICPPSVGEQPVAGRYGGFWVELHDESGAITFFRVLHDPMRSSVEIHSPDGNIRREFGGAEDTIFEVLVPDDPAASTLVFMGDYQEPPTTKRSKRRAAERSGARAMATIDLSDGETSGDEESGR